jgi:Tfp pilus assembly protein FimT
MAGVTMEQRGSSSRAGFTLIDLMVTLTVIVVVAAMVIPRFRDDTRLRLIAASHVLASDIELAQTLTIANPVDPTVVRFKPGTGEYWLAYADTPDDPIDRADVPGGYRVVFGQGEAASAAGVTIAVTDIGDDTLAFNAQGGIEDLTAEPIVSLHLGPRWIKLAISPTTGTITESSDAD